MWTLILVRPSAQFIVLDSRNNFNYILYPLLAAVYFGVILQITVFSSTLNNFINIFAVVPSTFLLIQFITSFLLKFLFSSSYTCILRFLAVTNDHYQKCPLCSERFNKNGLKSVKFASISIPDSIACENSERHDKKKDEINKIRGKEKEIESIYTFQLLSIEKDSLFPVLPGKGKKSSGNRPFDVPRATSQSTKTKKAPFNYSSFAPGLHPSIVTLSEIPLVPFNTTKVAKFSRLVTVTAEGCLQLMGEERSELLLYRQECLVSGTMDSHIDMDADVYHGQYALINNGDNTSTGTKPPTVSTTNDPSRSRSNSCWGSTAEPITTSTTTSSLTVPVRVRSESMIDLLYGQAEVYEQQGDTEYLPAITEALMLLGEREEAFRVKCTKLGVTIHASLSDAGKEKTEVSTSSVVKTIPIPVTVAFGKFEECFDTCDNIVDSSYSNNKVAGVERIANDVSSGNKQDDKMENAPCSSLSPSSAVFIPSSFPTSALVLSSSTPCTDSLSSLPPSSTASSSTSSTSFHMYQCPDGHLIFLHPLCTKCLLASVQKDPSSLPHTITGLVLETEIIRIDALVRQKVPFLRHLPIYCEVIFVELDMKKIVSADIWNLFQEEFGKRAKRRSDKEKIRRKEKRVEHDEMYVRTS